jgi:hypothetical protein
VPIITVVIKQVATQFYIGFLEKKEYFFCLSELMYLKDHVVNAMLDSTYKISARLRTGQRSARRSWS